MPMTMFALPACAALACNPDPVAPSSLPPVDAVDGGSSGDGAGAAVSALGCGPHDFAAVGDALRGSVPSDAPGADFGVVRPGCGVLYHQAFGNSSVSTAGPIASASKMPAATAIMTLVDAGKLSLDEPVGRYLPFWPPDKAAITLRMLLSHTSGLPGQSACLSDTAGTVADCARQIAGLRLKGTPGKVFIYGGADYQVAGRIAEVVSGKSWNDFFRDALATPCGLSRFTYASVPYNRLGSDANPRIAGGAASDVSDYLSILDLHLSGGRCRHATVLSPAAIREMQKDEGGAPGVACEDLVYPDNCHYGLGWWLNPPKGTGPIHVYGDAGAFGATPWIDTTHRYGAFLLIQRSTAVGQAIVDRVQPLLDAMFLD